MKSTLSPRDLAEAMGASESSVKRWVDGGLLRVERTAGGHRRIPLAEAIRFVRERRATLVQPGALGLPVPDQLPADAAGAASTTSADDGQRLYEHLLAGRDEHARGLLLSLYVTGCPVAAICDGPLREAMTRIGELWRHDRRGVFLEHRATAWCMQAMAQIQLLQQIDADAATAVGGALAGDPYTLPSLMAAIVVANEGFHAVNLGPDTPPGALLEAVDDHRAGFAWLSLSTVLDVATAQRSLEQLAAGMEARRCALILGGRALDSVVVPASLSLHRCRSMAELSAFAKGIALARRPGAPPPADRRRE